MQGSFTSGVHQQVGIGQQELDETAYWLDLLVKSGVMKASRIVELQKEVGELLAIFTASAKTAKRNRKA